MSDGIFVRVEHKLNEAGRRGYTRVTDQNGKMINGVARVDFVDDVKTGPSLILHFADFELVVEGNAQQERSVDD